MGPAPMHFNTVRQVPARLQAKSAIYDCLVTHCDKTFPDCGVCGRRLQSVNAVFSGLDLITQHGKHDLYCQLCHRKFNGKYATVVQHAGGRSHRYQYKVYMLHVSTQISYYYWTQERVPNSYQRCCHYCSCWASCSYQIFKVLKLSLPQPIVIELRLLIGDSISDFCIVLDL